MGRTIEQVPIGKGAAMEKRLCIAAMAVAGLLLLLFLLDLIVHFPFGGGSTFVTIDVVGVIAGGILLYLSWNALKDLL
ncbi:MAG: hypothetical protein ACJ8C4_02725 [Gemmataceae bacterium]